MRKTLNPILILPLLAAVVAAAGPAAAQDPGAGARSYAAFCAGCHGAGGKGDGPVAELLTLPPPDLTRLAAGNGGRFPVAEVVFRIDGRAPLTAHGSPMPPFGGMFAGEEAALRTGAGQPVLTTRPIADLVAFLEGLQR